MRIILLFVIASLTSVLAIQTSYSQSKPTITSVVKKSYNGSDVSCASANDGEITVTATGRNGEFEYSKDNGATFQSSNVFSNLAPGVNYGIVVRFQNGQHNKSDVVWVWMNTVNPVTVSSLNITKNISCFSAADGQVNITAWGGTGALQFSIDNGATFQSSGTFAGLGAGTYRIIVKDLNGCTVTSSTVTLREPTPITATVVSQQNINCGSSTGSVTIKGNGSTGDYNASIDGGASHWFSRFNTYTFNNLTPGVHNITIEDNYSHCTGSLSVTIATAEFNASISGNATVCSGNASDLSINISQGNGTVFTAVYKDDAGKTYTINNLTTGNNTITTGALTTSKTYSLVSVKNQNGCSATISGSAIIKVASPGQWLGINSNWNDAANWACGLIPTAGTNVTIPATENNPVIASSVFAIKNIAIEQGASLTVNGTLQVTGSISNNGNLDITNGTLELKGSALQTISGSWFVNKTIRNLKISNTAGVNLSETANDTLNITGLLSFGVSNATFNTKDNLTLKSTAAGTAGVADLTNNGINKGNAILGNVIVERYINTGSLPSQHNKCWVMISTPTQGQTIKQSWMENGDKTSTGYGTQITGNGVGFDMASGAPALKYYNDVNNSWIGVANTNDQVYSNKGYMLFVRGDRSATFPNYNNTTLRTKGTLLTGTMPAITVKAGKFQSVGNPYAAEVDIRKITTTGISPDIIIWDATLTTGSAYGLGAYQTLYKMGNNYYNLLSSPAYGPAGTVNNYIKSGLAFFVQAFDKDGGLIFTERSKSSEAGVGIALRNGSADEKGISIITNLLGIRTDGSTFVTDGTVQQFSDEYSNEIDNMDSKKIANSTENLSIRTGGKDLIIERRNKITSEDTIYYNLTGVVNQNYRFELDATGLQEAGLQGFIEDHYTNTQTPLNPEGITALDFTVTSVAGSRVANRFSIVFKTASVLPVTIASVKAVQKNSNIAVEWKVENQSKMQQYEIERSADGNQFIKVASVAANNNDAATYNWLDQQANAGYNYYRIRSVDVNGQATYSQVVKVQMNTIASSISVYPNPAVNATVHVQLSNQPSGIYYVRLINPIGQVMLSKQIDHKEGSSAEIIKWDSHSARGNYHLEITKPDGNTETISILY